MLETISTLQTIVDLHGRLDTVIDGGALVDAVSEIGDVHLEVAGDMLGRARRERRPETVRELVAAAYGHAATAERMHQRSLGGGRAGLGLKIWWSASAVEERAGLALDAAVLAAVLAGYLGYDRRTRSEHLDRAEDLLEVSHQARLQIGRGTYAGVRATPATPGAVTEAETQRRRDGLAALGRSLLALPEAG